MNNVQLYGLFLNFILYIIMILPILLLLFKKSIYESKKVFLSYFICITILEILLSLVIYLNSQHLFSIFSSTPGVVNYAIYCSKILFISSSLYGIKFLIPSYFFYKNIHTFNRKKTTILVLSKIVVNLILVVIGCNLFSTKGILFSFPICDLIYYIIYSIIFIKIL